MRWQRWPKRFARSSDVALTPFTAPGARRALRSKPANSYLTGDRGGAEVILAFGHGHLGVTYAASACIRGLWAGLFCRPDPADCRPEDEQP